MRIVQLSNADAGVARFFEMANQEPILLLAPDGREYILSQADDFEQEVETLRQSTTFQTFLAERRLPGKRFDLAELESGM
jgi:hypothetical protein